MFQIKKNLKLLTLVFAITFILVSIFGTNISHINPSMNVSTVYASPHGGFHSGSFKSSGGFTKSFKSGSFSNTAKKFGSFTHSGKSTYNSQNTKRSFIPIPIPMFWHTNNYGVGHYGSALWGISIFFKIIIFIVILFIIMKFMKKFRR